MLLEAKWKLLSYTKAPKTARLFADYKTQQCGVHMRRKRGRIVKHFGGLWCAKTASVLAVKAL